MKFRATVMLAILSFAGTAAAQDLATADGNSDGKVTVKEFVEYASGRLQGFDQVEAFAKKVDADGNGEISDAEFEKRREILQAMTSEASQETEAQGSSDKADSPHKVGDKATDFELQGLGETVKLSSKIGSGKSAVVVFSRANW